MRPLPGCPGEAASEGCRPNRRCHALVERGREKMGAGSTWETMRASRASSRPSPRMWECAPAQGCSSQRPLTAKQGGLAAWRC